MSNQYILSTNMSHCCPLCRTLMPKFNERHLTTSKCQLFLGIRLATCQATRDLPELVQAKIMDEVINISMDTQQELRERIKDQNMFNVQTQKV